MTGAGEHPIQAVELDEGVPTGTVSPETVRSGLESDRATVRTHAATVAAGLTQTDPDAVHALAPALCDRLGDDQRVVVYQCLIALSHVAEADPDAVLPAVSRVSASLDHDLPVVRLLSTRILGFVAVERPDALTDHAGDLVAAAAHRPEAVLDSAPISENVENTHARRSLEGVNRKAHLQQTRARDIAANALVAVTERAPDAVKPHTPAVVDLLSDGNERVVTAAVDVLRLVAEDDRAAVAPAVSPLCDLLDHSSDAVVATAVPALGYTGDAAAIDPLRTLAEDGDRPAALRDLAGETADYLATRSP